MVIMNHDHDYHDDPSGHDGTSLSFTYDRYTINFNFDSGESNPPQLVVDYTEAADVETIRNLEPYCQYMVVPAAEEILQYIKEEQPNTDYQLDKKLHTDIPNNPIYDIKVVFNPWELTQQSYNVIQQLPKIIKDSGEEGQRFQLDIFDIWIEQMVEHQEDNIVCDSN